MGWVKGFSRFVKIEKCLFSAEEEEKIKGKICS